MSTKLNAQFIGDTYFVDKYFRGFVFTCRRTADGNRGLGLDVYLGYENKDIVKAAGAKWDGTAWYFVFSGGEALRQSVAKIKELCSECEAEDRYYLQIANEPGIVCESVIVQALRQICEKNAEVITK